MRLLRTLALTIAVVCAFSLDASAQIAVKKGSFTTATATGNQSVTGVGLGAAGEAIIFFGTWNQTASGTVGSTWNWYGFATSSTNRGARWMFNSDAVSPTDNARGGSDTLCIFQSDAAGNNRLTADFVSFDGSDGNFTINWTNAPAAAYIVHFIVLGGTDLTNAKVQALALSSSTGNVGYTGVGFQPDFGIWVTTNQTSLTGEAHMTLGLGWAVSTTKRGSISVNADDNVSMTQQMDWNAIVATDRALICLTNAASTVDIEFDFVSWDSDGVTYNQINAPTANTDLLALFLKGGQYDAGSFTSCGTTDCTDTVSTDFQPKGVILGAYQSTTDRTVQVNAIMGFGAFTSTDGTQEGTIASQGQDAVLSTDVDQRTLTTKAITLIGSSGAVMREADGTGLNSSDFQLTWTTAAAAINIWAAIGDAAAAPTIFPRRAPVIITRIEPREVEVVEGR